MNTLLKNVMQTFKKTDFWFFILILGMGFLYGYQNIIKLEPQSVHVWRQTDCTSLAMNYYQNGMNFSDPEIHFLASDNKTSGYCVGEFPLLYYVVAGLYHIFGPNDLVFRAFNLLLFFLGLFSLYKLLDNVLRDKFWAMGITALLFCSPVIVFYANNFLPNVPAMSLVFMAWYFFTRYYKEKKSSFLIVSFVLFAIAGLLKITSLLSMIPLGGILLLELTGLLKRFGMKAKLFVHPKTALALFLMIVVAIYSWYSYAISYNDAHSSVYFSTHTWPLWDLSDAQVDNILLKIKQIWLQEYWHISIVYFIGIALLVSLWRLRRFSSFFSYMTITMMIGVIVYVLLWFLAFGNHDYYIIDILVWCMFVLVAFMDYLRRNHYRWYSSIILKLSFVALLWVNINYATKHIEWRFMGWMNNMGNITALSGMDTYLDEIGVKKTDKVISIPDPSPNHSLYLMNRRGWTDLYAWNDSEEKMKQLIDLGAAYLIVNDKKVLEERSYLSAFTKEEIGNKNGVYIYKLKP